MTGPTPFGSKGQIAWVVQIIIMTKRLPIIIVILIAVEAIEQQVVLTCGAPYFSKVFAPIVQLQSNSRRRNCCRNADTKITRSYLLEPLTRLHRLTQTHTDTHAHRHTHRHTDTHTHTHTFTHTHTHTHTHTQTRKGFRNFGRIISCCGACNVMLV